MEESLQVMNLKEHSSCKYSGITHDKARCNEAVGQCQHIALIYIFLRLYTTNSESYSVQC